MVEFLAQGAGLGSNKMLFGLIAAFAAMMFMQSRSQKKERKAFSEWLNKLKKNDQIVTKSGIYGVITSVRDDSIVIRIDDDKGAKMRITKDSVSHSPVENEDKEKIKS